MGYIKETYHYRPERVSQALDALTDAMPAYDGRAFCRSYGAAAGRLY